MGYFALVQTPPPMLRDPHGPELEEALARTAYLCYRVPGSFMTWCYVPGESDWKYARGRILDAVLTGEGTLYAFPISKGRAAEVLARIGPGVELKQ